MTQTKRGIFNALIGVASALFTSILQFVFIFIFISSYGVQLTGLVRTLLSFMSYFTFIEGGLGTLTVIYLFKPLNQKDWQTCNDIIATTKRDNLIYGIIYVVALIAIGFVFAIISNKLQPTYVTSNTSSDIGSQSLFQVWELALIVISLGLSNIIFFLFSGVYYNLIQADQNNYVNRIVTLCIEVATYLLVILLVIFKVAAYLPFLIFVLFAVFRAGITYLFVKLTYPWLKTTTWIKNLKLLKESKLIFIQRLASMLLTNFDIILLVIFIGYNSVAIYSLYLAFGVLIRNLLLVFVNSFKENYGVLASELGRIKWNNFARFQLYTYILGAVVFITQSIISPYFLNTIFYSELTSALHLHPKLSSFFIHISKTPTFSLLLALSSAFMFISEPARILVYTKAKFVDTIKHAYIPLIVTVIFGVTSSLICFVGYDSTITGFYLIITSVIIGNLLQFLIFWFYTWKNLTYNSNTKYLIRNILSFAIPIIISSFINYFVIYPKYSYHSLVISGMITMFVVVFLVAFISTSIFGIILCTKQLLPLIRLIPFIYELINKYVQLRYHENWIYFDSNESFLTTINWWQQRTQIAIKKIAIGKLKAKDVYEIKGPKKRSKKYKRWFKNG